nr:hypothetical protein [Burkholderia territorii]
MYSIEFTKQAAQALKAMPRNISVTIRAKIDVLAPIPTHRIRTRRSWRASPATGSEWEIGACCMKSKMAAL